MKNQNLRQWKMNSPIGELFLVASKKGLKSVYWVESDQVPYLSSLDEQFGEQKIIKEAVFQLNEYFSGKRKVFDLPLLIEGTLFQCRVWNKLLKTSFGKTKTYQEIAYSIETKGSRAVGTAVGKNPLCIVIPCHRIINSDGRLGGYSGGIQIKKQLLALERIFFYE